jgi:hypothetical protein
MRYASICYDQDMRTTVSIPDPILDNTKKYAEEHGITVSVVIEDALRRFLSEDRSATPPPFQLHTFRGAANPKINIDRTSEILDQDEIEKFLQVTKRNL